MSVELERDLKALEDEIYRIAGEPFNINSPQQLGSILFEKLALPGAQAHAQDQELLDRRRDARGAGGAGLSDLPERILRFREWRKLKSTYVDALPLLVDADGPPPHPLRAGGGGDRAAVVDQPQPAEHPDPHRDRAAASARPSARPGTGCCWSPTTARSSCASSRTSPQEPVLIESFRARRGHPPLDRGAASSASRRSW